MTTSRVSAFARVLLAPAPMFGLAIIAICWTSLSYFITVERNNTINAAIQDGTRLAHLMEENTVRLIKGIDRTLLLLRSTFETNPEQFDLKTLFKAVSAVNDVTTEVGLINPDGYLHLRTGYSGPPLYVGNLDHFLIHVSGDADRIFISKPRVLRTTGKRSILVSRRLTKPDGSFAGVISASIDPQHIEIFYESLRLPLHNNVVLRGADGGTRASYGFSSQDQSDDRMPRRTVTAAFSELPTGYFWGGGRVDGVKRLIFYRKFSGYPLLVSYGMTEDNIFAEFRFHEKIYVSVAGVLTFFVVIAIVINIRRQSSLERTNFRFRTALENMMRGLCMFDTNKRLVVCNRRYAEMYRLPPDLVKPGTSHSKIIRHCVLSGTLKGEADECAAEQKLASLLTQKKSLRIDEFADGRLIEVTCQPMPDGGWVATHADVTEQKRSELKIAHLAHHDGLTGAANRVSFLSRLEEASLHLCETGEPFSVLTLDLDRFKIINDTFGHPVGDALLKHVTERLQSLLLKADVVGRLGGDEFAIIQSAQAHQRQAAMVLAEKVVDAITSPFVVDGHDLTIGASVGIVMAPEHGGDPNTLLKLADLALYRVKLGGKNGYCFFEPEMSEASKVRHALECDLRLAIARNELELHYQPIVDAKTRKLCGLEALVRWRHPQKGLIFPDHFIPLAEETGLITQVGEWVLYKACGDAAAWPASITVAVNLSPVQLRKASLIDSVVCALEKSSLPPTRLELEITETALIDNAAQCAALLHQFKNLGCTITLDDFGTGYSSLSQLTMFPFDRIKIDKSFTTNMTQRADCAAIISATMSLAHSFGIATTAEGVETFDQLRLLRLSGVSAFQGYLFGKPRPLAEIDFDSGFDDHEIHQESREDILDVA